MNAHREPRPTRRSHDEPPPRGLRAINNSTQPSLNPYTVAHPNSCCLLGPPCYRGSEGTCIIRIEDHQASAPAEASVWPECSERAAHCLTLQGYPDPSKFAPPQRGPEECASIMACASTVASRGWGMICDGWDTICLGLEQISPSPDDMLCKILMPVATWSLRVLSLAATVWHLHQRNVSRVRHSHGRSCTRLLDAVWGALDELKRSKASVAAAKLMLALAALDTTDATQAWACLLLARPLYHDTWRIRHPKHQAQYSISHNGRYLLAHTF